LAWPYFHAFSETPRVDHPPQPAIMFPDLTPEQVEARIVSNFESLGMGLLETGMAWFWSDARVKRWFDVSGLHNLKKAQENNQGVLVIGVHFMSLELGGVRWGYVSR
jgi:KDO2-lipid IV(A) palmitoleoyltransferase